MVDGKTLIYTALTTPAVAALVPTVFQVWPLDFNTLPCLAFNEIDHYNQDGDYADGVPFADSVEFDIHLFMSPGADTQPIASAVDDALTGTKWTRNYSADIDDPSGLMHRVMRYSKRIYR